MFSQPGELWFQGTFTSCDNTRTIWLWPPASRESAVESKGRFSYDRSNDQKKKNLPHFHPWEEINLEWYIQHVATSCYTSQFLRFVLSQAADGRLTRSSTRLKWMLTCFVCALGGGGGGGGVRQFLLTWPKNWDSHACQTTARESTHLYPSRAVVSIFLARVVFRDYAIFTEKLHIEVLCTLCTGQNQEHWQRPLFVS